MNQEKSFVYTLILGVCMLISLILIGKILLYRPIPIHTPIVPENTTQIENEPKQEEDSTVQILRDADIADMISERLPENFPVTGMSVAIAQNKSIQVEGTLSKEKLKQLIPKDSRIRSALLLLPSQFKIQLVLAASSSDTGTVSLTPREIFAEGVPLPTDILPEQVTKSLNEVVNQVIQENYPQCRKVEFHNGILELTQ